MATNRTLTAIRGVRVGHVQDLRRRTGTTVVLVNRPAVAFADSRGGWPGTFDPAASDLGKTFVERHAFFLTGGDVYGLDAAAGIRRFLLERRLASPNVGGKMPSILGTVIYDLSFADTRGVDYAVGAEAARRLAHGRHLAGGDKQVRPGVDVVRRVDQAAVLDMNFHLIQFPASMLITAILTAMPKVTCGRITACAPSATAESISTPRFIGPGCMTMASGLASASFSGVRP